MNLASLACAAESVVWLQFIALQLEQAIWMLSKIRNVVSFSVTLLDSYNPGYPVVICGLAKGLVREVLKLNS